MHLRAGVTSLALLVATPAHADDVIPGHAIDRPVTGAVIGLALGGLAAASLFPMREAPELWQRQLWCVDKHAHDNLSPRAAALADGLLAASIAAPVLYLTGSSIEDADGDRLLVYGEMMAINAGLAQLAKMVVQRPRPYLYGTSAAARAYARTQGDDAWRSFYSGHAALSFGAAVAGAYLLGASTDSAGAERAAWAAGLGVAAATANLRVRAGKHHLSDVVIGGLIGATVGYVVPALHADDAPYTPSGVDALAALAGIAGGLMLSQLVPLDRDAEQSAPATGLRAALARGQLSPVPLAGGLGVSFAGAL